MGLAHGFGTDLVWIWYTLKLIYRQSDAHPSHTSSVRQKQNPQIAHTNPKHSHGSQARISCAFGSGHRANPACGFAIRPCNTSAACLGKRRDAVAILARHGADFLLTRGLRAVHGELVGWGEGSTRAVGAVRFDARREVGCIDWLVQGQVYGRGRWVRDTRSAEGGAWSEVGEGWGWACAVWCVVWCGKV